MTASNTAQADVGEDELNKAIEELRGVLHDGDAADASGPARTEGEVGRAATADDSASLMSNPVIMNLPVDVQIVLGSAEMPVSQLMGLQKGSTVALNRRVGEAVDVVVNGRRIARGEITVMENDPSRFGIRLTEITSAKPGK